MEQTAQIIDLIQDVLGPDAIGCYLHGSAALGTLRPRSDVDLLVVVRRPLQAGQRKAIVARLLLLSGRWGEPGAARPVELTIVILSDVRPWHYPPPMEFQYGEWMRSDFERGRLPGRTEASPDLAPLITMVLLANRPQFGPPPAEVLSPVPLDDLIRAIRAGIPALLADLDADTTNVLLTLARIWTTVATGSIRSKDDAADWVLTRLPEGLRPVLVRARAIYLGDEDDRWEDLRADLQLHADFVVGEIDRAAARKA